MIRRRIAGPVVGLARTGIGILGPIVLLGIRGCLGVDLEGALV